MVAKTRPMKATDSPANKWHQQREHDRIIGEEIDERRNGEIINRDE